MDEISQEDANQDYVWDFMEEGESYVQSRIKKIIKSEDIPLIKAGSLALLASGIRSRYELIFATLALAAYYYLYEETLDGAILGLSSVQLSRGQFVTSTFPTLLESYQSFHEWKEGKFLTRKQLLKGTIYGVGFYLGLKNLV